MDFATIHSIFHTYFSSVWVIRVSGGVSLYHLDDLVGGFFIAVLFGCFVRNIDGDSWFTWRYFLIYQGNPSISSKRTPMGLLPKENIGFIIPVSVIQKFLTAWRRDVADGAGGSGARRVTAFGHGRFGVQRLENAGMRRALSRGQVYFSVLVLVCVSLFPFYLFVFLFVFVFLFSSFFVSVCFSFFQEGFQGGGDGFPELIHV